MSVGMAPHARAGGAYADDRKPLPCNDLCRAWLGSHYVEERTDPIVEQPRTVDTNSRTPDQPVSPTVLNRKAVLIKRKQADPLPPSSGVTARVDEGPTKESDLPPRPLAIHALASVPLPVPRPTRVLASVPLPVPRPMLLDAPVTEVLPPRSVPVASREPPKREGAGLLDSTASVLTNSDHMGRVAPNTVKASIPSPIGDLGREDRARPSDAPSQMQVADNSPESIAAVAELEARYVVAHQHLINMRLVYAALTGKLFPLLHLSPVSAPRPAINDSTNGDTVAPLD